VSDPLNPEIETYCGDLSTPRSQHETGSEPRSTTFSNAEPAPERPAADASNSMLDAPMASYEPSAAADGQEGDPGTPSDREAADAAVMPAARPKTNPMPLQLSASLLPGDSASAASAAAMHKLALPLRHSASASSNCASGLVR